MEPIEQIEARSLPFRPAETDRPTLRLAPAETSRRPRDRVELSARFLRGDLINRVREQIDAGTYDNERRITAAADAMLRSVLDR